MMTIFLQVITSSAWSNTINEEKLKNDNNVYVWNFHGFSIHLPCNHLEKKLSIITVTFILYTFKHILVGLLINYDDFGYMGLIIR